MMIDASALVAILTEESGFESLVKSITAQQTCVTSPIAVWETVIRLTSKKTMTVNEARDELAAFCRESNIRMIDIDAAVSALSLEAFAKFGKRRHPAALNMGDCFAYACAKAYKVPLLFIGDDFSQTDVNEGF